MNIQARPVSLKEGTWSSESHLFHPEGGAESGKQLPGVLVLPEFWGLTQNMKNRAQKLAGEGYVTLAADLYGEGHLAQTAEEASSLMKKTLGDMDSTTQKTRLLLQHLKQNPLVDSDNIASIGHCLGGALSLHLIRKLNPVPLKGVVSFHGSLRPLTPPLPTSPLSTPLLVCHGEADSMIPGEHIQNFKKEMSDRQANCRFVTYPGAKHGFTNPLATHNAQKFGIDTAYSKETEEASWQAMLTFLKKVFA